jgi:DnaJ-class molecular chaperone
MESRCGRCGGRGKIYEKRCAQCKGSGSVVAVEKFRMRVDKVGDSAQGPGRRFFGIF